MKKLDYSLIVCVGLFTTMMVGLFTIIGIICYCGVTDKPLPF